MREEAGLLESGPYHRVSGTTLLSIAALLMLSSLLMQERAVAQVSDSIDLAVTREAVSEASAPSRWQFGGGIGAALTLHGADFSTLPGLPSCSPGFEGGSAVAPFLHLSSGYRPAERSRIEIALGFGGLGASMESDETVPVFNGTEGTDATFRHQLDASITALLITLRYRYALTEQLSIAAGPHLRIITGNSILMAERIVEPAGILFENDRRTRLGWDGPIPGINRLGAGLGLGARYEIDLEGVRPLRPALDLGFDWTPGDLVEGRDWSAQRISVGVTVLWSPEPEKKLPSPLDPTLPDEADRTEPRGS